MEKWGFKIATEQEQTRTVIPITPITKSTLVEWRKEQPVFIQHWLESTHFEAKSGDIGLLPNVDGKLQRVLVGMSEPVCKNKSPDQSFTQDDFWVFGNLSLSLPPGHYQIDIDPNQLLCHKAWLAWGLGYYQFLSYKKPSPEKSRPLCVIPAVTSESMMSLMHVLKSTYLVRDLINTPACDLGPTQLAKRVVEVAEAGGAQISQYVGEQLLEQNYPAIHAVGKASHDAPRLIDFYWGQSHTEYPELVLVGKGVCFDTGGLNIKSTSGMQSMKKDMGGAAHVLGLAQLIMASQLPVRLRVLIPAVENAVGSRSYRPGDILPTRKGLFVEVNNTDAEGRLILCDALAEACRTRPDLIIDFSTLTGAARVALGPDVAAFFTNDDEIAQTLSQSARLCHDPIWRLPLYAPYRAFLETDIADLSNVSMDRSGYGGAITAALYLQSFLDQNISWVHFDIMASNSRALPGRPEGGEAMGLRAVFDFLTKRYPIL